MPEPRVVTLETVEWEDPGVARPEGQRYWQPTEEPPAEHFNQHFYGVYNDLLALARYIEDHGGTKFLLPDAFTLIGDPPAGMAVIGTGSVPALSFADGVISRAKAMIRGFIPTGAGDGTYLDLYWTCPIATNATTVWEVRYGQFVEGQPVNVGLTTSQRVVGTGGSANVLVKTTFLMEGLVQGRPTILEVVRNGLHPSDAIEATLYVLFAEVR